MEGGGICLALIVGFVSWPPAPPPPPKLVVTPPPQPWGGGGEVTETAPWVFHPERFGASDTVKHMQRKHHCY
jgi:hypothetical protein